MERRMIRILVDADGCPVKEEACQVARRCGLNVTLVANGWMRTPPGDFVELVVVGDGFDAADDWIVEHAEPNDIVITTDIPLAARCIDKGVRVLSPKGKIFDESTIGGALANREFSSQMREHRILSGGPAPFSAKDRSRFLQKLDQLVQAARKSI
jgi:uncharacterized protein